MNLILSVTIVLGGLSANGGDSACTRALYLLSNRHLNQTWLDSARTIVAGVRQREPGSEAGLCLWARICLQFGDDALSRSEKLDWYSSASSAADTLRRGNPRNPDGHMWWATAQGRLGQLRGVFSSAGIAPVLKREYEQTLSLDSGYALAWYALGRMYAALPALLGGNLKRAEDCLRRGVEADPDYTVIRLELARILSREQRWAEARRELDTLLATCQPTNPAEFFLADRPAALGLLDSIESGSRRATRR